MRRRTFLRGLLASAALLAQAPAASRLEEGRPSATAQATANLRAAHQLIDTPKIFDDPLALRIIGPQAEAAVRANAGRGALAPFRPFVALRSRYAEDELARAVQRGVRQYVVLGAGLDTFAYRNPYPSARLRVFEVDHPATQVWKRGRLRDAGIAIPESMTFAAVDFEKQTLADGLRQAGVKLDEPAFFSMLGVVVYLTPDAIRETLKGVAAMPAGTELVFDYAIPPAAVSEDDRAFLEAATKRVAGIGEPWLTYFEPSALIGELRALGFTRFDDVGHAEAHDRYFQGRTDGLRLNSIARLLKAGR